MDVILVSKIIDWLNKIKEKLGAQITRLSEANFFDAALELIFLILIAIVIFYIIFQCLAALLQSTIEIFKVIGDFFIVVLKFGSVLFILVLILWFFCNSDRKCLFKIEDKITRCIYVEKTK